ncbi:peptidyl-prolyl cis-trans isomerase [candidate division KSB1 bacterium]|nr:peptidyl-prolyl cis-trans isomerase [candidate division KSB1 bacterium]
MKKTSLIACILLILFSCSKPDDTNIVARVGDIAITDDEFKQRYEFTPQILQTRDTERNKRNFMTSLIGEKVLAQIGYDRDYDDVAKYKAYSTQLENEAIVEKLIETEISDKIEISNDDLKAAYLKSKQTLRLQVLNFSQQEQAVEAKRLLDQGVSIHEIKRTFQTQNFISADSVLTLTMKWGEAHPVLEDVAYSLGLNEISEPKEVDGIFFIMKLIDKSQDVFLTDADFYTQSPSLKKILRDRKSKDKLDEYMQSLMKDRRLTVPHEMFELVSAELLKLYNIKGADEQSDDLMVKDVEDLDKESTLAEHMDDMFAKFDSKTWTVRDFLTKLSVGPYPLSKTSERDFINSLRRIIRRMAELETLAAEGKKLGLHKSDFVKNQSAMWNDAFVADMVKNGLLDTVSVSDEEIRYFYEKNPDRYKRPQMLKLREIVVDNEALANELLARIKNGEDMARLARIYSRKKASGRRGGIDGFYTTQAWGRVGTAASRLKIGQLGGPVRLDSGEYSIFRLVETLEAGPMPLDQVYDDARHDVLNEKKVGVLDAYLANVLDDAEVEINSTVYDTLQVEDISMLVFKRHFPKRMAAPPVDPLITYPQWQNQMDAMLPRP